MDEQARKWQVAERLDALRAELPRRLGKGKGRSGPEFFGCCNTGRAAEMYKMRSGGFAVGRALQFGPPGLTVGGPPRFFKTYKGACNAFIRLCREAVEYNVRARAEVKDARRAVRSADPDVAVAGAFALADHGLV